MSCADWLKMISLQGYATDKIQLMSYLRYLCLSIVVSNTYCAVCLFCLSSSCVPYVASFSRLSILIAPWVFSNIYLLGM